MMPAAAGRGGAGQGGDGDGAGRDRGDGAAARLRTPAALLTPHAVRPVLRRTLREFRRDELTDRAAALTYYAVLSVFPALIAVASVLGLLGERTVRPLVDDLGALAPREVHDLVLRMLAQLERDRGSAGLTLAIGVVLALWSASGYVAAFTRSANVVHDIGEGRPAWKLLPLRFAVTVVVLVVMTLAAVAVVFTGSVARRTGEVIGVGATGLTVWNAVKWPVLALLVALVVALLHWATPNVRRGFTWVLPGALAAVLAWLAASALFGLYVANFGSYDKTYGSLAAVIVFLVWLWLSNTALLLGLEFNAELLRERAVRAGHPPDEEPYAQPRDTRRTAA